MSLKTSSQIASQRFLNISNIKNVWIWTTDYKQQFWQSRYSSENPLLACEMQLRYKWKRKGERSFWCIKHCSFIYEMEREDNMTTQCMTIYYLPYYIYSQHIRTGLWIGLMNMLLHGTILSCRVSFWITKILDNHYGSEQSSIQFLIHTNCTFVQCYQHLKSVKLQTL